MTDINALGVRATADKTATATAVQQVFDTAKKMEVPSSHLWYFKMYGSGAGQSFHEQWEQTVDSPMTLRIRQSADPRERFAHTLTRLTTRSMPRTRRARRPPSWRGSN